MTIYETQCLDIRHLLYVPICAIYASVVIIYHSHTVFTKTGNLCTCNLPDPRQITKQANVYWDLFPVSVMLYTGVSFLESHLIPYHYQTACSKGIQIHFAWSLLHTMKSFTTSFTSLSPFLNKVDCTGLAPFTSYIFIIFQNNTVWWCGMSYSWLPFVCRKNAKMQQHQATEATF